MELQIQSDFGYIPLVAVGSAFVLTWMGFKVGAARKKFNVMYPNMYSDKEPLFNCIQRAHQNTLENYPVFLLTLIFGGLYSPRVSAIAGVIWLVGRIFYAKGYYTGEPKNRNRGVFAYIGLLTNLYNTVCFGLKLLGYI